ncbi:MAG: pitrilysin family protein [Anaerolineaceae bacterium]|nr:pitrilysin family protein [Anaerolineaceae bacterium]
MLTKKSHPSLKDRINSTPDSNNIARISLPNKCTLLSFANPSSPAVVIRGYMACGAIAEDESKLGTANLMSAMLMAGTEKHNFRVLNQKIEAMGASLYFGAGELSISFAGQCLRQDLPDLLSILVEVLRQPVFPDAQFQRYQMQMLTMLAMQEQDTFEQAELAFNRLFYGDHPYARPLAGTRETLSGLKREDLPAFHERFIGPEGMAIAVVGGIEPAEAAKVCTDALGTWQQPGQQTLPKLREFHKPAESQREHIALEEKSQTDLLIGTLAPETMSRDYYACSLGNNILGQFGMMGRLGNVVREKSGLAYGIQSELGGGLGPSPWLISAGVNPQNLEKALRLICKELEKFISQPVTEQELRHSRTQMIGRLPLSLESNAGIAQALLSIERYGLSLNYLKEFPGILETITAQEILAAARRCWDLDKLVITSSGRALA